MNATPIEWATQTWNPIHGCSPISPGCKNCYAKRLAKRMAGRVGYDAVAPFRPTMRPDRLLEPTKLTKPQRIFVGSMGDLFHEEIPFTFIGNVFRIMHKCPQHTFLLLTKRPHRMAQWFEDWRFSGHTALKWPDNFPNVWIGVTCEHSGTIGRVEALTAIDAPLRFVSVEPMLSPLSLELYLATGRIGWVICGAEQGHSARPMRMQWAFNLFQECERYKVPFFFKKNSQRDATMHGKIIRQIPQVTTKGLE